MTPKYRRDWTTLPVTALAMEGDRADIAEILRHAVADIADLTAQIERTSERGVA